MDMRLDVMIKVLGAVTIALVFPLAISTLYSADVLSSVGVDLLEDVNAKVFTVVITVEFTLPAPQEGVCRPMADLDCVHFLQAHMPSYHVWSSLA